MNAHHSPQQRAQLFVGTRVSTRHSRISGLPENQWPRQSGVLIEDYSDLLEADAEQLRVHLVGIVEKFERMLLKAREVVDRLNSLTTAQITVAEQRAQAVGRRTRAASPHEQHHSLHT